jgi:protease-4
MISLRLATIVLALISFSGCVNISIPFGQRSPLKEAVVLGTAGPKIAMVDIAGSISMSGSSGTFGIGGNESLPARVRQELDLAARDPEVAALLLRIDSPGGTVIASEVLYNEVRRWKAATGKPVIAQMMGVAASGGYYVAMAADWVRAYPSTVTGSIGVIFVDLNVAGLMDKVGVKDETLTSGAFKDAGSPFRPVREEERAQLGTILQDMYDQFVRVVDIGRPKLDEASVRKLADGRIYSARQAQEAGLIDAIGDLPSAVEATRKRAGISGPSRLIVYHRGGAAPENLFSAALPTTPKPAIRSWAEALPQPGFFFLWSPGLGTPVR